VDAVKSKLALTKTSLKYYISNSNCDTLKN